MVRRELVATLQDKRQLTQWRIEYKMREPGAPVNSENLEIYLNGRRLVGLIISWHIEFAAQQLAQVRVSLEAYHFKRIEMRPTNDIFGLPHRILIDGEELFGVIDYRCFIRDNVEAIELTLIPS